MGWVGHDLGMEPRVHAKYKMKYRVRNWADHDRALVQHSRGRVLPESKVARSRATTGAISSMGEVGPVPAEWASRSRWTPRVVVAGAARGWWGLAIPGKEAAAGGLVVTAPP